MNARVDLIAPDEAEVRTFFQILHEAAGAATEGMTSPGLLQLSRVHPADGKLHVVGRFPIGDVDRMTRAAMTDASTGHNVYVEGRTVRADLRGTKRGSLADTVCVFALVIDADADKGRDAILPPEAEPSLSVESSPGNRHDWFCLTHALGVGDAQALGAAIRAATGADDDTGNPTQPYRVAGTPNYPGAKKAARGRVVSPTSIITEGRSHSADELQALFPSPSQASRPATSAQTPIKTEDRSARDLDALLAALSAKRTEDLSATGVADRSAHFLRVTGWLKGDGYTLEEAVTLWEAFPAGAGVEKYGERLEREVTRVWAKAGDDPQDEAARISEGAAIVERLAAKMGIGAGAAPELLPIVRASDFAGRPRPRREFVDEAGLIPCRNVTLLFGDGGTGKSLLTLQLACGCTVTGSWIGLKVRRGPVLYYSAEDDEDETHIRLEEIAAAEGFDVKEAKGLHIALMAGRDAILANEQARDATLKWTGLYDRLVERIDELRPKLLVLDNLVDAFAGNQNSTTLARQFIGALRGLAIGYDCAIVVLAHPSQSGMTSGDGQAGARAWSNSARSRLYFRRDKMDDGSEVNPNRRSLDTMKSNYGPTGGGIALEWQDGRFIRADQPSTPAGPFSGATRLLKAERVFMEMVRRFNAQQRNLSPSRSVSFAPALFAAHPLSEGLKKREFETAMNVLLERGEIIVVSVGPPSKRRSNIVIAAEHEDGAEPLEGATS